MKFWRLSAALLLALMLAFTGCSSDESADSADTTAAADANGDDTAAAPNDDADAPSDEQVPDDVGAALSGDCRAALTDFIGLQTAATAVMTGQEVDFDEAKADLKALADAAPDDISDAFDVVETELSSLFDALADAGFTAGELPTAEQMSKLNEIDSQLDSDALDAASAEIQAYYQDACGEG